MIVSALVPSLSSRIAAKVAGTLYSWVLSTSVSVSSSSIGIHQPELLASCAASLMRMSRLASEISSASVSLTCSLIELMTVCAVARVGLRQLDLLVCFR
jgi:hypothetical protein